MSDVQIVKNFFDKKTCNEIINYLDNYIKYIPSQWDSQYVRDYYNNLPFFVDIHYQLEEVASFYFKEKVKPSYSFLSLYKPGGTCPLHIDRNQCRYTIDYLIRSDEKISWPINIGKPMSDDERDQIISAGAGQPETKDDIESRIIQEQFTTVNLNPNDAVLYSGTHQWHYRPEKLASTADLVFFHFVPENFSERLN